LNAAIAKINCAGIAGMVKSHLRLDWRSMAARLCDGGAE